MNPNEWKKTVTGAACPDWCASVHDEEDPADQSVSHTSESVTVALPPLVNGEHLRLTLATMADEDYCSHDRERPAARVDLALEDREGLAAPDYVPVTDAGQLDELVAGLRQAADTLEQWRHRLPAAV
ncbi:DUF6907 domain-containing protein [Streptomyces sp. NPDC001889]